MDYLVTYGCAGDFSRFRAASDAVFRRGDRVVVRTFQGLDLGEVLCPFTPGHAQFLSGTAPGELLRAATPEDEEAARLGRERAQQIFADACRLGRELALPLEILDVEVALDGRHAVVHHLRREAFDDHPLLRALSRTHDLVISMDNLALAEAAAGQDEGGCGRPDCGREGGGGGCSSCGTGGGCATGCGKAMRPEDVAALLTGLGTRTNAPSRMSLL
jgi:cell fate regulator YaaT (PSP1 superfamily)